MKLTQKSIGYDHFIFRDVEEIIKIQHKPNCPSEIVTNKDSFTSFCLYCIHPRCIYFTEGEISLDDSRVESFPHLHDTKVCPNNAIFIDNGEISIDSDQCIGCLLCASRCPVGAIFMKDSTAQVSCYSDPSRAYLSNDSSTHEDQIDYLSKVVHEGMFDLETSNTIEGLYIRMNAARKNNPQFPNIITRNYLIQLGIPCIIRRHGDVYIRFDAVFKNVDKIGVCEIEFDNEQLESPRAIIDDVAVLNSRYNITPSEIIPLIVNYEFPNKRSDYWDVINDIDQVLNLKIQSITIGSLAIILNNIAKIDFRSFDFFVKRGNTDIAPAVAKMIGKPVKDKSQYGILDVKK